MRRLSINWEGDLIPSPHGDYVEYRDVVALQDEVERLRKALQEVDRVAAERMQAIELQRKPAAAGGRLFGWVCPDDARKFNSGRKESCRVFKKRTELFCMPLSNTLGPNHYQKPPVGEVVTLGDGLMARVVAIVPEGLTVEAAGIEFNVRKWSWSR